MEFGEALAHAQERGGDAEQIVGVGGGLGGDAVRVARHDRVAVTVGERKEVADHVLESGGEFERSVAQNGRALRREDVLARTAGMNGGHALTGGFDEHRLPGDVAFDAKRGIGFAAGLDRGNACGRPACEVLAELSVAKARDDRRAVDGVEPEEFVLFHLWVLWSWSTRHGCVGDVESLPFAGGLHNIIPRKITLHIAQNKRGREAAD